LPELRTIHGPDPSKHGTSAPDAIGGDPTQAEKDQARATFKRTFGFHPMLAFCDNTNEALTGML